MGGDKEEYDPARGFAGAAPGQSVALLLTRLTRRDLELLVGPAVLPLLPSAPRPSRDELELAAVRVMANRGRTILADLEVRRTLLRNLDPGKLNELKHRLGADPDAVELDEAAWGTIAGFFGLVFAETASGFALLPVERVAVKYGLFPHQRSVVRRTLARIGDGQGRTLVHMPTGAGKTRTAMHVLAKAIGAQEPSLVIWLASTKELLEQAADAFLDAWPALGDREVALHRFWGSYGEAPTLMTDGLLVAGLAKLHSWRQRAPNDFLRLAARARLVVVDEAHQAVAPTYRSLIDALSAGGESHSLLGLSATPGRSWNDVDEDERLSAFFHGSKVVLEAGSDPNPVKYLLDEGYLARPQFGRIGYEPVRKASDKELRRIRNLGEFPDDSLERFASDVSRNLAIITAIKGLIERGHKRIILFAPTVSNAEAIAEALVAYGIRSSVVTGETPATHRAANLRAFKSNDPTPTVLCNFGVLTTGFDAPQTSAAVIARPTRSLVLYSQMVGRATRGPRAGGNATSEILTVHDPEYPGFGDIAEAFFNWEDVWNGE